MTQYRIDPKEPDILKALRCPNHPKYRAIRKPAVNCHTCKKLYRMRQKQS